MIPPELKSLNQWVCATDDSKVPMRAYEFTAASSTDPSTWSSYDIAIDAVEKGYYQYPGFVFNDNGIVGIDIDCGYDEDGFLTETAADILSHCTSYTEKSKSGRGFHILLFGDIPFKGKNNLKGVEIYKSSRYFIITGDTLLYADIVSNQGAIDYVLEKYFPETVKEGNREGVGRIYTPLWEVPKKGERIKLRPVYPRITPGSRNICLTSLAGLLHNLGYTKEQIYDELIYCNASACDPPVGTGEIQNIVNSVTRYKR